jgi:mannan endo-1,4-beta-mannosidase
MLNNWNGPGGINTYCHVSDYIATTFYNSDATQTTYQVDIKFVVNRHKSSSTIFSQELCNEPCCHGCDSSVIHYWASITSAYIKSLDSMHMVTLGDEGWACGGGDGHSYAEGVDLVKNLAISTLDHGIFHMYPNQWGYNYN